VIDQLWIIDPLWGMQALVALFCAILFSIEIIRAWRYDRTHPEDPVGETGIILAAGLTIISVGNVLTALATGLSPDLSTIRDFGGTLVRGTLAIIALYLLFKRPLSNRDRKKK
jgi:hypothetical protein